MKKLVYLLLLVSGVVFGQSLKFIDTGEYISDTIVNSQLSKEKLYSNALSWLSSNFKDSRYVIESKDLDLGEIVFKGNYEGNTIVTVGKKKKEEQSPVWLNFTGKIIVKDSKYRVIFSNLYFNYITRNLEKDLIPQSKTLIPNDKYNAKALSLLKNLQDSLLLKMSENSDHEF